MGIAFSVKIRNLVNLVDTEIHAWLESQILFLFMKIVCYYIKLHNLKFIV